VILARLALHHLQELDDPQAAAQAAIKVLDEKVSGLGGVVLLSPDGRPGWHCNTPYLAFAYCTADMDGPVVGL
jgi:isoaspartyl peptidase/L-asparaginase-like protein (Ntn-hydrolase superfamily)